MTTVVGISWTDWIAGAIPISFRDGGRLTLFDMSPTRKPCLSQAIFFRSGSVVGASRRRCPALRQGDHGVRRHVVGLG